MGAPAAPEAVKSSGTTSKRAAGRSSAKINHPLVGKGSTSTPPRVFNGGSGGASSSATGGGLLGMKKIFRRNSKGGSATDRTGSDDEQGGQPQPPAAAGGGFKSSNAGNSSSSAAGPAQASSPGLSTPNRRRGLLFPFQNKRRESNGDGVDEERSPQASSPNRREIPTIVLEGVNLLETPRTIRSGGVSSPPPGAASSPNRASLFQWQDEMEALQRRRQVDEKQERKTRDGFCRRVSAYDGVVIEVDGKAAYEMGNYLGGGVAGVVYEGHRLRPMEEYPVRLGRGDSFLQQSRFNDNSSFRGGADGNNTVVIQIPTTRPRSEDVPPPVESITLQNFLCMTAENAVVEDDAVMATAVVDTSMQDRVSSLLTDDGNASISRAYRDQEMALEATMSAGKGGILIDTVDAPSRSKHYARATFGLPDDASLQGAMEETVAIKVLNPVGFRLLSEDVTNTAVVARRGEPLSPAVLKGDAPMEERHVWWLINPNSRNLRTLQRYGLDANQGSSRRVEVDRGSAERGLRISLIAAYQENGVLKELPLTRCIEIWGHVPFGASDADFKALLTAIDRINQGQSPATLSLILETSSLEPTPGRVGTGFTDSSYGSSLEESKTGHPMVSKRTGIFRAATTERKTVYCDELKAYIALPAVPSKYLKWLRQRRAATKEIRNMMLIGRHKNVVHLFEVLEYIQEAKSTMFLILELVRGGELFDLISSNSARISNTDTIPRGFTENETVMRKFFRELASGVHYCHMNGIAHRDLKPENLLVHNSRTGACTLKIADFGLSAAFGPNSAMQTDADTVVESLAPDASYATMSRKESDADGTLATAPVFPLQPQPSPIKERMDKLLTVGGTALSFLTCGVVEDIINCRPGTTVELEAGPSPLKRMTSVVGSPHYVAPEIISQNDAKRNKKPDGYDGTRADVWSIGVICYAMLFRSLPFGEDLLRCPRYQSYKKWYDEVKKVGGRRSSITAALDPIITDVDERDFLGPHWFFPSKSSPESRDIIVYMLNPDPDNRPTVQMVLQHPWLLKQA